MFHNLVLVIISVEVCWSAPATSVNANEVLRSGFSSACRGPKSISRMVSGSEVVVEAGVIAVSPVRNNIYAVTLQIQTIMKESKSFPARKGQKLQLLFIKPSAKSGPEVRSLPSARSYLEACIYEMDLKVGKKYNLFLAAQKGRLMGKALMARYVMTGPPLLASNKTRKRIEAATCPTCARPPKIKSLDVKRSKDGKSLRLVCRSKRNTNPSRISWTVDGQPLRPSKNVIIRSKRFKSIVVLNPLHVSDSGVYACSVNNPLGKHSKSFTINIEKRTHAQPTSENDIPRDTTTTAAKNNVSRVSEKKPLKNVPKTTEAPVTTSVKPVNPAADVPCPLSGYCLNGGTCSFIPWLGELSCSCAPGFQGARCERKTTSALYSSLSLSSTLCLFGLENPYHSC